MALFCLPLLRRHHLASRLIAILSLVLCGLLITTPALAAAPENTSGFSPVQLLQQALTWVQELGPLGAIAFVGLYILAAIAFLPGSLLTLGAGVVFGVGPGALYVFLGATLGATAAFLIGRYLARDWILHKLEAKAQFQAIDAAVGREGFKIVLLTRLSPVFPFNLLNYSFGVTSVSLKDYVLASVGMLPGIVMYVYLGSLAGSLSAIATPNVTPDSTLQWTLRLLGFMATVAVTLYVTWIARQALTTATGGEPSAAMPKDSS